MAKLLNDRDGGFSLVTTSIVMTVVFALGGVWLAYAEHASTSAAYDRHRQQAIDAAMAGLAVADAALSRNSTYTGIGVTAFGGGRAEYEVSVAPDPSEPSGYRRIIASTGYAPTKVAAKVTRRVVQVVDLEPVAFQYALLSETQIVTGSQASIVGDLYANGDVSLGNSQDYVGDIYVQGNLTTGSNQTVTGEIRASGNVALTNTSTVVNGSVFAGGSITTGGWINNDATAGGTVGPGATGCTKVRGTCSPGTPPPPIPVQHLPTYTWDPANYASVTLHASGAAFVAASSKHDIQGAHKVAGDVTFANKDDLYLTGDTVIVASGSITLPRQVQNHAPGGATIQLTVISTGAGTVKPQNNFTIPSTVKTLFYTQGVFDAKNSCTFAGALYAQSLANGANVKVTHQPLDDTGFDWTLANPQSFTIRNVSTREVPAG